MMVVSPGAASSSQQRRRFQLRRRNRRLEHDRDGLARARNGQRQATIRRFERARTDPLQRIEHAPHRPAAQRRIAIECRGDRAAADRAEDEPATGARIAEIQRRPRLGEAADTDAVYAPRPAAALFQHRTERAQRLRGAEDVLALEQSADPRFSNGQRAENERADGDRLIARHPGAALQRAITPSSEW